MNATNNFLYATVISASGSGIYRTATPASGASSWTAFNGTGLSSTQNLGRMTISPVNAAYRLVSERGVGLFGSLDSGATWTLLFPNINRRSSASDPVDPEIVFIGTNGGIYKTTNLITGSPTTWTQVGASIPVASSNQINGGSEVPGAPECTGYAATGTGVVKTTDCGRTGSPTGAMAFHDVRSIGIDRTTVHTTAYAGTNSGGVWKTTTGGTSWSQFNTGLPDVRGVIVRSIEVDSSSNVFAGFDADVGIFRSAGGTGTRTSIAGAGLTNTTVNSIIFDPSNSTNIMIGTGSGIFRTSDGGANWLKATGCATNNIQKIVYGGFTNTYYAATGGGICKTVNGGANWAPLTGSPPRATSLSADGPNGWVYAGTNSTTLGGIFLSKDGGLTWTDLTAGKVDPFDYNFGDVQSGPGAGSLIVTSLGGGIYLLSGQRATTSTPTARATSCGATPTGALRSG